MSNTRIRPSLVVAVITPADMRAVADAAAQHATYPAVAASVTDLRTREVVR